jgi:hypothetical protein
MQPTNKATFQVLDAALLNTHYRVLRNSVLSFPKVATTSDSENNAYITDTHGH